MKIGIVGTGYVGLVAGACLADIGHSVMCVDIDRLKVARLAGGAIPIFEPGLAELVRRNAAAGRLSFSDQIADAAKGRSAVFLAVGTPTNPKDGSADMSHVHAAAKAVIPHLDAGSVIVTKSTVPVGTGADIAAMVDAAGRAADVTVVSNPEFLREGAAIRDFMEPDRIVIGLARNAEGNLDAIGRRIMHAIYQPLESEGFPVMFTDRATAEMIKYASNAFLATKIAFINEIADLAERTGADVEDIAHGIGMDHRIGKAFLKVGPGYGGSCFPKDTQALAHTAALNGMPVTIVDAVIASNARRKKSLARRVADAAGGTLKGKQVAVLGLTFKAGTDDMRDSPSIDLIPGLGQAGANVCAYDPEGMERARSLLPPIRFATSVEDCCRDADITVILTEWGEFKSLDLVALASMMRGRILVDFRNLFDRATAQAAGLDYHSVGRP
jgi:UDPglucose 6-dehydrogenase